MSKKEEFKFLTKGSAVHAEEYKDLVHDVRLYYTELESLQRLLDVAKNKAVIEVATDKYVIAESGWREAIDKLGRLILGKASPDSTFNISVHFDNSSTEISFDAIDHKEIVELERHLKEECWIS